MSASSKPKKNKRLALVPISAAIAARVDRRDAIVQFNETAHRVIGDVTAFEHDIAPLAHQLISLAANIDTVDLTPEDRRTLVLEFIANVMPIYNNERDRRIVGHLIDLITAAPGMVQKVSDATLVSHSCFGFLKKQMSK